VLQIHHDTTTEHRPWTRARYFPGLTCNLAPAAKSDEAKQTSSKAERHLRCIQYASDSSAHTEIIVASDRPCPRRMMRTFVGKPKPD
jgi:hypothetical protein